MLVLRAGIRASKSVSVMERGYGLSFASRAIVVKHYSSGFLSGCGVAFRFRD